MNFLRQLWTKSEAAHLRLGKWGEQQAEHFLKHKGLKMLGRRVRVGAHDEIDLLARDGNVLVVVEVKTRSQEGMHAPRKAVHKEKKRNLTRAGTRYAKRLTPRPEALRFDIVEVIGAPGKGSPVIRHHPSAFGLSKGWRF